MPSVMDVVVPAQNKAGMEAIEPRVGKKVKFSKTLLIERKRKLKDVTNVPKEKVPKRLRTVDDMLNAPLPPIVYERRGARLQGKSVKSHPSQGECSFKPCTINQPREISSFWCCGRRNRPSCAKWITGWRLG